MLEKNNLNLVKSNILKRKKISWTEISFPRLGKNAEKEEDFKLSFPEAAFLQPLENRIVEVPLELFISKLPFLSSRVLVNLKLSKSPEGIITPVFKGFKVHHEPGKEFKADRSKLRLHLVVCVENQKYKFNIVIYSSINYQNKVKGIIKNKFLNSLIPLLKEGFQGFLSEFFLNKKTSLNLRKITNRAPFFFESVKLL